METQKRIVSTRCEEGRVSQKVSWGRCWPTCQSKERPEEAQCAWACGVYHTWLDQGVPGRGQKRPKGASPGDLMGSPKELGLHSGKEESKQ